MHLLFLGFLEFPDYLLFLGHQLFLEFLDYLLFLEHQLYLEYLESRLFLEFLEYLGFPGFLIVTGKQIGRAHV